MTDTPHIDAVARAIVNCEQRVVGNEKSNTTLEWGPYDPQAILRALLSPEITEQWEKAASSYKCPFIHECSSVKQHSACAVAAIQQAIREELVKHPDCGPDSETKP